MGNNSGKKQKKTSRITHMRNVMPKFKSCRLNGVTTFEKTYIHIHIDRYKHPAELSR